MSQALTAAADIRILPGLAALAERYDGFILDLWGVLHDGHAPYPGAVDALARLRRAGKRVCLLSNAPRRCAPVAARLTEIGIAPDLYDHLMTSGEATFEALASPPDAWHAALGPRALHIGPPRDRGILEDLGRPVTSDPQQADFVLNTGLDDGDVTLDDYDGLLAACHAARLPMLCANPDIVVYIGDRLDPCAGALASRYEALGGDVAYHGKPHPGVYRRCRDLLGVDDGSILAVGDGFGTDIAGANRAGLASVLVASGIHRETLGVRWGDRPAAAVVARLAAEAGVRPDAAIPTFAW